MNENEKTMHENLWHALKEVLRGKFMTVNAYIKQEERSQIKSITQSSTLRKRRKVNSKQVEGRK